MACTYTDGLHMACWWSLCAQAVPVYDSSVTHPCHIGTSCTVTLAWARLGDVPHEAVAQGCHLSPAPGEKLNSQDDVHPHLMPLELGFDCAFGCNCTTRGSRPPTSPALSAGIATLSFFAEQNKDHGWIAAWSRHRYYRPPARARTQPCGQPVPHVLLLLLPPHTPHSWSQSQNRTAVRLSHPSFNQHSTGTTTGNPPL